MRPGFLDGPIPKGGIPSTLFSKMDRYLAELWFYGAKSVASKTFKGFSRRYKKARKRK